MLKKVRKAVFPVAGMGTRFLPATKASAKEMLAIVDKPLIQYAVEEAIAAGITDLIFITGRHKRAIEDHFDKAYELENELAAKGKTQLLEIVQSVVPKHVNCIYIRQNEPLGLGHAVLCAAPVVGDEPFAVLLADDLMDVALGKPSVVQQMIEVYVQQQATVLAVQNVPRAETRNYGIVSTQAWNNAAERIVGMVEKPMPEQAPSTLAVVGRYVLSPRIFHHLQNIQPGLGGEIQLTDGIVALLTEEAAFAFKFDGVRYDCGSKIGFLKATVDLALRHPEVAEEFTKFLATRAGNLAARREFLWS